MKVRMGFVTNSSSSCFILQFDKKPKTIEDIKNIFFKERSIEDKINLGNEAYPDFFKINDLCKMFLKDIKKAEAKSFDDIVKDFGGFSIDMYGYLTYIKKFDYRAISKILYDKKYEKSKTFYECEYKIYCEKHTQELFKRYNFDASKPFIVLEYEDKGKYGALDYTDFLDNFGIRISCH